MSAHDRKALLRAFYGLATLWLINGVFGLVRASGPGALLPYIEIAALLAYWAWVFNWWRQNRPTTKSQPAARVRASKSSKFATEEIRRAVDREEAIAKERNRRRKQQLNRVAGTASSQVAGIIRRYRFAIAGALILLGALGLFQGYRTVSDSLARQAEIQARADAAELAAAQTRSVMAVWNARNNCLESEFSLRWQDWYLENPETQTHTYFFFSQLKEVTESRTLPLPESLIEVTWFPFTPEPGQKKKTWLVSQSHFKALVTVLATECRNAWPPPKDLNEGDLVLDYMDFGSAEVPYEDQWKYQWLSPFPYPNGPARIINAP